MRYCDYEPLNWSVLNQIQIRLLFYLLGLSKWQSRFNICPRFKNYTSDGTFYFSQRYKGLPDRTLIGGLLSLDFRLCGNPGGEACQ